MSVCNNLRSNYCDSLYDRDPKYTYHNNYQTFELAFVDLNNLILQKSKIKVR